MIDGAVAGAIAVFLPLMPLGVEHLLHITVKENVKLVFLPLMPLGVEHPKVNRVGQAKVLVFLPLMPLSVEHCSFLRLTSCTNPLTSPGVQNSGLIAQVH